MSKKPAPAKVADSRHREAPFLQERERYLRYCADSGATSGALSIKRNELIWIARFLPATASQRSEEHTSELQSLMRISYAVFCLKKKNKNTTKMNNDTQ